MSSSSGTFRRGELPVGAAVDAGVFVAVRTLDGRELELGRYASEDEARGAADDFVRGLRDDDRHWPRVGGSLVRPSAVVSVDVAERPRWSGSEDRAAPYAHGSANGD